MGCSQTLKPHSVRGTQAPSGQSASVSQSPWVLHPPPEPPLLDELVVEPPEASPPAAIDDEEEPPLPVEVDFTSLPQPCATATAPMSPSQASNHRMTVSLLEEGDGGTLASS